MNKNFAARSTNEHGQAPVDSTHSGGAGRSQNSFPAFNQEEIEKLKNLLGSQDQPPPQVHALLHFQVKLIPLILLRS